MQVETLHHFGVGRLGKLNFEGRRYSTPNYLSFSDSRAYPHSLYLSTVPRELEHKTVVYYGSAFRGLEAKGFGILPDYNFGFDVSEENLRDCMERNLEIAGDYPNQGATLRGGKFPALWKEFAGEVKQRNLVRLGNSDKLAARPRLMVEALTSLRETLSPNSAIYFPSAKPWHIALLSFLGVDLFDNLFAYKAASELSYLTPSASYPLKSMRELPCSCQVCSSAEPGEIDRGKLLTHNQQVIHLSLIELRECMRHGDFYLFLEERSQASPEVIAALRIAYREKYEVLEKYLPVYY